MSDTQKQNDQSSDHIVINDDPTVVARLSETEGAQPSVPSPDQEENEEKVAGKPYLLRAAIGSKTLIVDGRVLVNLIKSALVDIRQATANLNFEVAGADDEVDLTSLSETEVRILRDYYLRSNEWYKTFAALESGVIYWARGEDAGNRVIGTFPMSVPVSSEWPWADGATGFHLIIGGTASGKTYYGAHTLDPDILVRVGEPSEYEYESQITRCVHPTSIGHALGTSILLSALGFTVTIDSLRLMMRELPGAAAKGGISASFETAITAFDNLANLFKISMVGILNPLDDDNEDGSAMERYYRNAKASTNSVTYIKDRKVFKKTARLLSGRVAEFDVKIPEEADEADLHFSKKRKLEGPGKLNGRAVPALRYFQTVPLIPNSDYDITGLERFLGTEDDLQVAYAIHAVARQNKEKLQASKSDKK